MVCCVKMNKTQKAHLNYEKYCFRLKKKKKKALLFPISTVLLRTKIQNVMGGKHSKLLHLLL